MTSSATRNRDLIVMEYVEGESLASLLRRERLTADRVIAIGREIASALGAAHAKGVIHRDLKPANIQVTKAGSVKVLDFGVAGLTTAFTTVSAAADDDTREPQPGTRGYMSPEQMLNHHVDERSDIFSAGIVLFEMATGERAFVAREPGALMDAILRPVRRADAVDGRVPGRWPMSSRRRSKSISRADSSRRRSSNRRWWRCRLERKPGSNLSPRRGRPWPAAGSCGGGPDRGDHPDGHRVSHDVDDGRRARAHGVRPRLDPAVVRLGPQIVRGAALLGGRHHIRIDGGRRRSESRLVAVAAAAVNSRPHHENECATPPGGCGWTMCPWSRHGCCLAPPSHCWRHGGISSRCLMSC